MQIYTTCCPLPIAYKQRRGSLHIVTATLCIPKAMHSHRSLGDEESKRGSCSDFATKVGFIASVKP